MLGFHGFSACLSWANARRLLRKRIRLATTIKSSRPIAMAYDALMKKLGAGDEDSMGCAILHGWLRENRKIKISS